jgi:branched-chain amino acid transport system ATP-binding protein
MLEVRELRGGYGAGDVLNGLGLRIGRAELVAVMGRNGMGKTTTVRAIMGLLKGSRGSVRLEGVEILGQPAHRIACTGIGLVPEGRQVFPNLTVRENLIATAKPRAGGWTLERAYGLFPRLAQRAGHLGAQLSGGEQQMLAIGRALLTNPRLLILDEATEGLAPLVRGEIHACLATLRQEGHAILLIDKHLGPLLDLADRLIILEKGRVAWQGRATALREAGSLRERLLGV